MLDMKEVDRLCKLFIDLHGVNINPVQMTNGIATDMGANLNATACYIIRQHVDSHITKRKNNEK